MRYHGEADRSLHYRINEHLRAANNPSSYPNNALAQHYGQITTTQKRNLKST